MRVVMISKALVVGAYQRKAEEIAARPGVDLTVVVPPHWDEETRRVHLERAYTTGYEMVVAPIAFSGRFHLHFYPTLSRLLREVRPEVVHVDEEPYNLATFQAVLLARRLGARTLFFTWQNLYRRYPPPFRYVERYVLARADHAVAGNAEAVAVLRRKSYRGPISLIPQFGIDPQLFRPRPEGFPATPRPFTIGYVGRIVEQKGLAHLLRAVAGLPGDWRLSLLGSGPYEGEVRALAARLGIGEQVDLCPPLPSTEVVAHLHRLDVLVLPSLTRPNWKEQFGRVLVEAMACELPVVGSNSGEIPHVMADGGIVYPEGDPETLCAVLRTLMASPDLRARLGRLGRARVLARFTHARLADEYARVYREVAGCT